MKAPGRPVRSPARPPALAYSAGSRYRISLPQLRGLVCIKARRRDRSSNRSLFGKPPRVVHMATTQGRPDTHLIKTACAIPNRPVTQVLAPSATTAHTTLAIFGRDIFQVTPVRWTFKRGPLNRRQRVHILTHVVLARGSDIAFIRHVERRALGVILVLRFKELDLGLGSHRPPIILDIHHSRIVLINEVVRCIHLVQRPLVQCLGEDRRALITQAAI